MKHIAFYVKMSRKKRRGTQDKGRFFMMLYLITLTSHCIQNLKSLIKVINICSTVVLNYRKKQCVISINDI